MWNFYLFWFWRMLFLAQQCIPNAYTTATTLLESLHYLDIQGPQHTRVRLNDSTLLRCRVTFVIVNRTHVSGTNESISQTPTWYGIAPGSVQPRIPLVVQWVKDGFGYDQDSLWHTFNGRYRIAGSKDEGIYDLLITRAQFEDEGEYACQASVSANSSAGSLTSSSGITSDPDAKTEKSTAFPMSLIKSEVAHLAVIVPPRQLYIHVAETKTDDQHPGTPMYQLNQSTIWIRLHQSITFRCSTDPSRPTARIQWYLNNCPFLTNSPTVLTNTTQVCQSQFAQLLDPNVLINSTVNLVPFESRGPWSSANRLPDAVHRNGGLRNGTEHLLSETVSILRITVISTLLDNFQIRCGVANAVELFNGPNLIQTSQSAELSPFKLASSQQAYSFGALPDIQHMDVNVHYVDDVQIEPIDTGSPDTKIVEFHPIRFHCKPGRGNPHDAELYYAWTITKPSPVANTSAYSQTTASQPHAIGIPFVQTTPLPAKAFEHSSAWFELLPTRESNGQVLICTIQSRLPDHYAVSRGLVQHNPMGQLERIYSGESQVPYSAVGQNVVQAVGMFTMNVMYGPRIIGDPVELIIVQQLTSNYWPVQDQPNAVTRLPNFVHGGELYPQIVWLNCATDSNPKATITWYQIRPGQEPKLHGRGSRIAVKLYRSSMPPRLGRKAKQLGTKEKQHVAAVTTSRLVEQYPGPKLWERWLLQQLLNFTCVAHVPGFADQTAIKLIGQAGPPVVTGSSPVYATLGTSVTLHCDIRGLPEPSESNIHWRFQFVSNPPDPGQDWGRQNSPVQSVTYAPATEQFIGHQRIRRHSFIDKPKSGELHWHVQQTDVPLGWISHLQIDRVEVEHYGLYNCSAVNAFGTGWQLFVLNQQLVEGADTGFITTEHLAQIFTVLFLLTIAAALAYFIWFRQRIELRPCCCKLCCLPTTTGKQTSGFWSRWPGRRGRTKSVTPQASFQTASQSLHIVNRFDLDTTAQASCATPSPMPLKCYESVPLKSVYTSSPEQFARASESRKLKRSNQSDVRERSCMLKDENVSMELGIPCLPNASLNLERRTDSIRRNPFTDDSLLLHRLSQPISPNTAQNSIPRSPDCLLIPNQHVSDAPRSPLTVHKSWIHTPDRFGRVNRIDPSLLSLSPRYARRSDIPDCSTALVEVNPYAPFGFEKDE